MTEYLSTGQSGESFQSPEKQKNVPTFGVLMMGGTLAMEPNARGVLAPAKNLSYLLSQITLPEGEFNLPANLQSEVINIDSTNMNSRHWEMAIRAIEELQEKCDGILIPHGTDTMAYTASAIGLAMKSRLRIPIVLTGAQLPIGVEGTDARTNLERGFKTLKKAVEDGSVEPMIFFNIEAYRGLTAFKYKEAEFDAFTTASPTSVYRANAFGIARNAQPRTLEHVIESNKSLSEIFPGEIETTFSNEVIGIELKPGLTAEAVEWIAQYPGCRALLLKSFGAGNVPGSHEQEDVLYNLIPAIKKITDEMGKIIVVTSPFRGGNTVTQVYETGIQAIEAGAIDAGKMTDEAAYIKTCLLLGQEHFNKENFETDQKERMDLFKKLLKHDFAGETGREFDYIPAK
ncbi:MAG TPA: asparaginase domain-containing protein [Patescibacteria group bacterium]|nr:asparaginase domain-containing protein [Patescibacteria group bacterium]